MVTRFNLSSLCRFLSRSVHDRVQFVDSSCCMIRRGQAVTFKPPSYLHVFACSNKSIEGVSDVISNFVLFDLCSLVGQIISLKDMQLLDSVSFADLAKPHVSALYLRVLFVCLTLYTGYILVSIGWRIWSDFEANRDRPNEHRKCSPCYQGYEASNIRRSCADSKTYPRPFAFNTTA